MTTPAQISDLILAAGKASGLLDGIARLFAETRPELARQIRPICAELDKATWAAMGRPDHPKGALL